MLPDAADQASVLILIHNAIITKNLLPLGKLTFEEIASSAGFAIERVKENAMQKTAH